MNVHKVILGKAFPITDTIFNKIKRHCQADVLENHQRLSFESRGGNVLVNEVTALEEDNSKKKMLLIKIRVPFSVSKESGIHTEFYLVNNFFFKGLPEEKSRITFENLLRNKAALSFDNSTAKNITTTYIEL